METHDPRRLVTKMTEVAATASERFTPGPLRPVLDRALVDVVCATNGGVVGVAAALHVDPPAVDAWRSLGIPPDFRSRLAGMTVLPPLRPARRAQRSRAAA